MGISSILILFLALGSVAFSADWIGEVKKVNGATYQCKCYYDNSCWPSKADWDGLNTTVGGALKVALPPAAPCHKTLVSHLGNLSTYDAAKCAEINSKYLPGGTWIDEQWTTDQTVANLWPFGTNNTCLPTSNPNSTCSIGYYPDYVIMATTKEHIRAGIDFARTHNLRLLIRNTGHDFMGRTAAWGSLAINTHSFKNVKFMTEYTGPGDYKGGAVTVGSAIQGRELYRQAFAQNPPVVVVGGECPTVGYSGGYLLGGGHGPLTTIYGMGADSVLSFDVVTAAGEFVTANAQQNSDLFWALKGGGPATFGVVTSVTVKTHPEVPTAGTIININQTLTNDTDLFWKGFNAFHELSNRWIENGMFVYFELQPGRLHIQPFVGPRMNAAKIKSVLKPLFDKLDSLKVPYDTKTKEFPTFFELYIDMFEDEAGSNSVVGGRIITKNAIEKNSPAILEAYKTAMAPTPETTGFSVGHVVSPGVGVPSADNAINPVWRNASTFVIHNILMDETPSWDLKQQRYKEMTNIVTKKFVEVVPDGGSYVNEGDLNEPNWQQSYWGSNYPKLLELRKKWDPSGVFYAKTTVGTEDWEVIDYGTKLCKKT